jgi:mannose-1-phosphate guanylyltransferase
MKAMILAAGFGTRLRPLTLIRPKALMPVANIPVIDGIIEHLRRHGVKEIVVNAHHLSEQIVAHLDGGLPFGIKIEVVVEREILGTGGGLKNTGGIWGSDPFIVANSDIVTDIDLSDALSIHKKKGNIATLVLHDYRPFNTVSIDGSSAIVDISDKPDTGRLAFTGIHIVNPELLGYIPDGEYFDIIKCYRYLIKNGDRVGAYVVRDHYWRDIGTINSYILANKEAVGGTSSLISEKCRIHYSAALKDWAVIGENCLLEEGVEIKRSILWDGVKVRKGVSVIDSIVTSSKEIVGDTISEVI